MNYPILVFGALLKFSLRLEKIKQKSTADFLKMAPKNGLIPQRSNTEIVNNIRIKLSIDESIVEIFFDSQIYGRNSVALMAAGAVLSRLTILPSYVTPKVKYEPSPPRFCCTL